MRTARLLAHAVRALTRHRLRSSVMMFGSLVAIGALTLIVCVGEAAERRVMSTMRQLFGESSLLLVARGNQLLGGPRGDAARLTLDDLEAVARAVPEIAVWDPQQAQGSISARYGDTATQARLIGESERAPRVWERGVTRGEFFDAGAVATAERVAVIGETVVQALFGDRPASRAAGTPAADASRGVIRDPIGADILVGNVPFRVIGVLERQGTDLHGMDRDNEIIIPISTMMRRVMNVDTIGSAKLLVHEPSQGETAARAIRDVLRERHAIAPDAPDDFRIVTPLEVRSMVATIQRTLALYLPLVVGVILLISAIVAATLMLASVKTRIGEIGLRRALGAQPSDIGLQFLLETTATMVGGGVIGIVLGSIGAQVAAVHLHLGDTFSWRALVLGLTVSVVTGLVAGVLPARRAARLPPIDALR